MMQAVISAALTVAGRLKGWMFAALGLIGLFWLTNRQSETRGRVIAETTAAKQQADDVIDRLQTRQEIDRQSRDGGSRQRLRDRFARRKQ